MLVPNFANQLFQNVFHSDDAQSAAVFVDNHGNMGLGSTELVQKISDLFRLVNENGRGHYFLQGLICNAAVHIEVLNIQHTHDIVDVFFIDQKPGKTGLGKDPSHFFLVGIYADSFQVCPVSQNILCHLIPEFDGVLQQLAFAFVDTAFLLNFFHQ